MKGPDTSITSRLNTGAYGVTVCWHDQNVNVPRWACKSEKRAAYALLGLQPHAYRVKQQATVSPDGSLSLEPEPWAVRHYRRAVMGGAGVYQAGLWAMLAGKRHAPILETGQRAARGGNDLSTFRRFELAAHKKVRHSARWKTAAHTKQHPARVALFELHIQTVINNLRPLDSLIQRAGHCYSVHDLDKLNARFNSFISLLKETAKVHISIEAKRQRGSTKAYRAILRRIIRLLRRLVPSVKRCRPPSRIPRPLYSRAIPPAATLAPPAL